MYRNPSIERERERKGNKTCAREKKRDRISIRCPTIAKERLKGGPEFMNGV